MIAKLKLFLGTTFLWAAYWASPNEVRQIMSAMRVAVEGLPEQLEKGRVGGVVIAAWASTDKGAEFARAQYNYCNTAAADFREEWEAYGPDYDEA